LNLIFRVLQLFQKYDLVGFLTIGGLTSLLNLVMFALSVKIGLSLYISVAIGNFFATLAYFLGLSKLFSGPGSVRSIARFLFTVVTYYFASIALLEALNLFIDNVVLSRTFAILAVAPINYFVQKYFVFRN
jgi:putative flippase GtrA